MANHSEFFDWFRGYLIIILRKRPAKDDVEATPKKKAKTEVDDGLKKKLKKQSDTFWEIKKEIQEHAKRDEVETILQANGRYKRKKDNLDVVSYFQVIRSKLHYKISDN